MHGHRIPTPQELADESGNVTPNPRASMAVMMASQAQADTAPEALFKPPEASGIKPLGLRPHNHPTREIRELGKCPACDAYHAAHASAEGTRKRARSKAKPTGKAPGDTPARGSEASRKRALGTDTGNVTDDTVPVSTPEKTPSRRGPARGDTKRNVTAPDPVKGASRPENLDRNVTHAPPLTGAERVRRYRARQRNATMARVTCADCGHVHMCTGNGPA